MKKLITNSMILLTILSLASCCIFEGGGMSRRNSNTRSGIVRVAQFTDKKTTLMWAHHDPTQRQTLMYVDENGQIKILAEQSPDAGVTNTSNISGKAKVNDKVDAEALLAFQAQLEKLTNRTSSLMITRETLYAIRELCFNGTITKTEALSMYEKYLDKLVEIAKEDAKIEEAKAKGLQVEVDKAKVELEKLKLEQTNKKDSEKKDDKKDETPDNKKDNKKDDTKDAKTEKADKQ